MMQSSTLNAASISIAICPSWVAFPLVAWGILILATCTEFTQIAFLVMHRSTLWIQKAFFLLQHNTLNLWWIFNKSESCIKNIPGHAICDEQGYISGKISWGKVVYNYRRLDRVGGILIVKNELHWQDKHSSKAARASGYTLSVHVVHDMLSQQKRRD